MTAGSGTADIAAKNGHGKGADLAPSESMVQRLAHTRVSKASVRVDLNEIGTYGLRQYGGFVLEEWLRQLSGPRRAWVYREMMDNDPVIGAIFYAMRMLARGVAWPVEPGDGSDSQAAEFIEECMGDMSHTWGDLVSEVLSMLGYGWSFHEIVYKRRSGPQSDSSKVASSDFTDGKIGWRKLPVRAQETLHKWQFDDQDDGLVAMEQIDYHGRHNTIPIEKALLFRTSVSRNNPEGRSLLRNSFVPWFRLKNIQEIEAIGIERDLAGIPVATPPEGVDLNSPANVKLLAAYQELVTTIRRDEDEGVVLPQAGAKLELLTTGGSRQIDTDAIVRRYEQRIASSILADFILIGQDAVGSFAMVDVKSDLFGIAFDAILDIVCEVFNRYAIPRLLALNGMDTKDPPKLTHASAGRINLQTVGAFLNQLSLAGAPIPWTEALVEALMAAAGLPANFEEPKADPAPTEADANKPEPPDVPVPPVPPAPAPVDDRQPRPTPPVPGPPQPPQPVSKADQQTGAMVALYPSSDVASQLAQDGGENAGDLHLTLAFLGDAAKISDPDQLRQAVSGFAATCPPLSGQVSGIGHFTAGPEPVTYASADVPELPDARERLVGMLHGAGFPPAADHGFTPHVTLAYDHRDPPVANHPLKFDHVTVALAGRKYSYPLTGKTVQKAQAPERRQTAQGTVINVTPVLQQRAKILENQFNQDVGRAFGQLGEHAQRGYLSTVEKADAPSPSPSQLAGKVVAALNVAGWFQNVLQPVLQSHSQRVLKDTLQTLSAQIGLAVNLPDPVARQIIAAGGSKLGLADVEAGVRQSIMQSIAEGRAQGLGPAQIARNIREMVPAGRFVNAGSGYRSQLISRTETLNAQRASTLAAYQAAPNVTAVEISDGLLADSDAECIARDGDIVSFETAASLIADEHPLGTMNLSPVVTAPSDVTAE